MRAQLRAIAIAIAIAAGAVLAIAFVVNRGRPAPPIAAGPSLPVGSAPADTPAEPTLLAAARARQATLVTRLADAERRGDRVEAERTRAQLAYAQELERRARH